MSQPSFNIEALQYDRTLVLAIELSSKSWVPAAQVPGLQKTKAKRSIEPDKLVVRFQHLHPLAARLRANVGIIRTTSNPMILVELLNLTFECEFAAGGTQMSNSLH
jgi:hypothetical protein